MTEVERLLLNALETMQEDQSKALKGLMSELEATNLKVTHLSKQLITEQENSNQLRQELVKLYDLLESVVFKPQS